MGSSRAHTMSIHRAHECVFRVRYRDQRSRLLSLLIALYEKRRDSSREIEKNHSSAKFRLSASSSRVTCPILRDFGGGVQFLFF